MSIRLMDAALDLPLDPSSKLVLVVLADHANNDGDGIYPGNDRIARRASLSRRQTMRLLQHLERHDLIARVRYPKGGRGHAVEWSINVGVVAAWQRVTSASLLPEKGDMCDIKGCHLGHETVTWASPQPSGTIKNQAESQIEIPEGGIVAEFHRRIGKA